MNLVKFRFVAGDWKPGQLDKYYPTAASFLVTVHLLRNGCQVSRWCSEKKSERSPKVFYKAEGPSLLNEGEGHEEPINIILQVEGLPKALAELLWENVADTTCALITALVSEVELTENVIFTFTTFGSQDALVDGKHLVVISDDSGNMTAGGAKELADALFRDVKTADDEAIYGDRAIARRIKRGPQKDIAF